MRSMIWQDIEELKHSSHLFPGRTYPRVRAVARLRHRLDQVLVKDGLREPNGMAGVISAYTALDRN